MVTCKLCARAQLINVHISQVHMFQYSGTFTRLTTASVLQVVCWRRPLQCHEFVLRVDVRTNHQHLSVFIQFSNIWCQKVWSVESIYLNEQTLPSAHSTLWHNMECADGTTCVPVILWILISTAPCNICWAFANITRWKTTQCHPCMLPLTQGLWHLYFQDSINRGKLTNVWQTTRCPGEIISAQGRLH